MSDKVQKFDPSKLMDGVKDRIRAEFASLIPDDAWQEMVKKEVDYFFYRKEDEGYSSRRSSSQFERMCNTLLEKECKERFGEYLKSAEFSTVYNEKGSPIASQAVERFIVENSGKVLASFFGNMMQGALDNMKMNLNTPQYY